MTPNTSLTQEVGKWSIRKRWRSWAISYILSALCEKGGRRSGPSLIALHQPRLGDTIGGCGSFWLVLALTPPYQVPRRRRDRGTGYIQYMYEDIRLSDQDSAGEIGRDDSVVIYEGAVRIGEVRGQGRLLKHQTAILLADFILVTMSLLSHRHTGIRLLEVFVGWVSRICFEEDTV